MKSLLGVAFFILPMYFFIFLSCSKSSSTIESSPAPQRSLDTLTGRQFEFNDLTWKGILSWGNVMVEIDRPDLFYNPLRALKVTIRLDTSFTWLNVFHDNGAYIGGSNFYYTIAGSDFFNGATGHLYIYPVPQNLSLNSTRVSIKVKFL